MNTENNLSNGSADEMRGVLADCLRQAVGEHQPSPLSSAQQRLWFLDQLEPNSPLYNIPSVARLKGRLDVPALERALNVMLARHESLRSRFISVDGKPVTVIDEDVRVELRPQVVPPGVEAGRTGELQKLIHNEVNRPFDLSSDHLFRATLYRIHPEEHILILNMHHIVSDEWSLKILFRELTALYEGFATGREVHLPELPIQYGDYAVWQREWLQSEAFEKQLAFWKAQLAGNPPAVELSTDHPRRSHPTFRGAVQTRALGQELARGLRELANNEGVTMFMLLLAAFKVLLYRYTHQEDIIVGSPMAGRTRVETEDLIGFFVNTLPFRTRMNGEATFREVLKQVREAALEIYSHQDLPFDKLIEALHPERALNQTPFVKVMFLIQNEAEEVRLPGLQIEFLHNPTDTAKFDLSLGVTEDTDRLLAGVEYNTDLFEAASVCRLLEHYECLLQGIVAQPAQHISELPLLSEDERRQLLGDWAPPATAPAPAPTVHGWFEIQAARTPDAIALVSGAERLTYRELNTQANQLAHYLRAHGVGPETPVALLLERSAKMIVAILGVLKAGGAYVPIDPAYPKERLEFMLEDSQAPVLLTQEKLRGVMECWSDGVMGNGHSTREPNNPAIHQISHGPLRDSNTPTLQHSNTPPPKSTSSLRVICLDSDWPAIAACPVTNLSFSASNPAETAAYIIYTSGSTGKPKGVIVTHQNVVRLFQQTEPWYGFNDRDVWTLFHSYTFDFSVWELWGPLLYGGRLVLVPYLISRSPNEFYELLAREKVTVLSQTPSAFRQLLWAEATAPAPLPLSLRYVVFGGEALELQSLKPWFERHGDQQPQLVNMYGITETTVHVTYRVIRQVDLAGDIGSVIGVPMPDLRIYLLDEKLQPVPIGVPGEICIAGAGLARGYLNRPELTAQRFVPDPFSRQPGGRLYRSGDLARYTANGELEFLGRMDHQVKIRGFRVELGEIEAFLNRHPAIRESAVLTQDDGGGSKRLVAYLVPTPTSSSTSPSSNNSSNTSSETVGDKMPDKEHLGSSAPSVGELREYLGQKMPDYMIPSAFVWLPALPLTSNGKVDRRALPSPDFEQAASGQTCVAPRNPTETALVDIWRQILRRKSVSIHENFFHLGGHSLLATQVVSRVAGAFNIDLPVRTLFEAPTIASLADAVQRAQLEQPQGATAITRRERGGRAFKLLERLDQLSDAELEGVLRNSELGDVLS